VNPAFIVVPYYDPAIVFFPPRRGFVVATAINFGYGVTLGAVFEPWGWGSSRFVWTSHEVFLSNAPWQRGWSNRAVYVHPYAVPRYEAVRRAEDHRLVERSQHEREAEKAGRPQKEEHKQEERKDERRKKPG